MSTYVERRSLIALFRNHPETTRNERYGWGTPALAAARREMLLQWAATLSDWQLLSMRNLGPKSLAWIREMTEHLHRFELQNVCETCGHREAASLDSRIEVTFEHSRPAKRLVTHMRQSANGCVSCERKWSDHTIEERSLR